MKSTLYTHTVFSTGCWTGEMVAGSGMDGIEARFPAKAGDAYYFRPNCTVGFYNKPGANAYILAVRSKIPLEAEDD